MFAWLNRFRFLRKIYDELDYRKRTNDESINKICEEISVLKKICLLKDFRVLEKPSFMHFFGDPSQRERNFDGLREKARNDGYHFVYKKNDDDEIWVKFEEGVPK